MIVRLDKDVTASIKKLAKRDGRSVARQVNVMLRECLAPKSFMSAPCTINKLKGVRFTDSSL